jgi:hypothetical protein
MFNPQLLSSGAALLPALIGKARHTHNENKILQIFFVRTALPIAAPA